MGPLASLPAWGTESLVSECAFRPGGAAANTALALAGLYREGGLSLAALDGAEGRATPVSVYSVVGDDAHGRSLRRQLGAAGVDVSGVSIIPEMATSVSVALVHSSGERSFVTDLGALQAMDSRWVQGWVERAIGPGCFLLTGACLLPGLPPAGVAGLFRALRARGLKTVLDTGWATDNWAPETVLGWHRVLPEVDFFLPNELEAQALTGNSDPAEAARELQAISGGTVIVTLGPDGVLVAAPGELTLVPTISREVADTTGAGDIFAGGLLYGLAQEMDLRESVILGQRLAGYVMANRRTLFPGYEALADHHARI